ncbi:PREDICTED: aldehyde oxidase 1-like [Papilio polytes]|uniref:aldehyde oxidase 1-like n=1 Tax=Papilio polytes TaxID=76194 RepID=UPI00067664BD|nr:PREDICTED: aldehyde oxidase 1-like [Papilio polytes]
MLAAPLCNNCYNKTTWNFSLYNVVTDTASNSWCRSPGSLEAIANAELIMERISYEMSLDPVQVRLANLDLSYNAVQEMWDDLKIKSQYDDRRAAVQKFNSENRWLKRGLRVAFMRWSALNTTFTSATVSVYSDDGTVSITHGAIEIGQGINTKLAQICAYFLQIPLSKILVKGQNTIISPNAAPTSGSVASLNVALCVQRACEDILRRLEPIKQQMGGNPTWEELVYKAYKSNIDLQGRGILNLGEENSSQVYGVIVTEVEVDILTGQSEIKRVDLLEDVGQSVSPEIDIGQIEGAFIMGLGYWTCEKMEYEPTTGEVLSDRAWNYWLPQAKDIAQDFRIYFRENSYSTNMYLGAKATGEPGTSLAVAIPLAMREAISAARLESGIPATQWFQIDGPYTTEQVCLAAATKFEDFKYF